MKCNGGKISEAPLARLGRLGRLALCFPHAQAVQIKERNGRNRARKSRRRMRQDKRLLCYSSRESSNFNQVLIVLLCKWYGLRIGHQKARLFPEQRASRLGLDLGRRERAAQRVNCFDFTFKRPFQIANEGLSPAKVGRRTRLWRRRLASKHP